MARLVTIGEKEKVQKEDPCIGIDLGTTYSVVALSHNQKAKVLPLAGALEENLVPSLLDVHCTLIPQMTSKCFHDFKNAMECPDKPLPGGQTPKKLSTAVLKGLREKIEVALGQPITNAVITVPARFSNIARKATKEAAEEAGLNVIRLLNEPTAAALAYGLNHSAQGVYLVYDFGGGTFDATLLRLQGGVFQVLATTGDLFLGGHTIDCDIAQFWGHNPDDPLVLEIARTVKEGRSTPLAPVLRAEDFDLIVERSVRRTFVIVQKMLAEAQILPSGIDGVVLVGGSTRLKRVRQDLADLFGKDKVLGTIDPDRAVAMGASLHAEALTHHTSHRPLLLDVVPASLGIETIMGYVENIIPKYTPTPISVQMSFSTIRDNQTQILIHVVQGDDLQASNCASLGRFVLKGIPPMPKGQPRLTIQFSVDENGLLKVEASEALSGVQQGLTIESYL